MKAQNLNRIANIWHFVKSWWWALVVLGCLLFHLVNYWRTVRRVKKPEVVPAVVPVIVESTPEALSKMRENEILIIKKYDEERIKILLLPDSALQPWADSLYNSRR